MSYGQKQSKGNRNLGHGKSSVLVESSKDANNILYGGLASYNNIKGMGGAHRHNNSNDY